MKKILSNNEISHRTNNKNKLYLINKRDLFDFKPSLNIYYNEDSIFFIKKNKLSRSFESKNNNEKTITNASSTMSNDKENNNSSSEHKQHVSNINKLKENLNKTKNNDINKNNKNEIQNKKKLLIRVIKNRTNTKKCFVICKLKNKGKNNNNFKNIDTSLYNSNDLLYKSKSLNNNKNNNNILSDNECSGNNKTNNEIVKNDYNNKIRRDLAVIKNRAKSLFEKYDSLIRSGIINK